MSRIPVLIVGAGPTGLVLALRLAHHGVPFRIIDRNSGPGQASRAMVVQARTLEFYGQLGLADAIIERGIRVENAHCLEHGREVAGFHGTAPVWASAHPRSCPAFCRTTMNGPSSSRWLHSA